MTQRGMLPKLPGGSPRSGRNKAGATPSSPGGPKTAGKSKHTLSENAANNLTRDEDLFRTALSGHEATEFASVMAQYNASSLKSIETSLKDGLEKSCALEVSSKTALENIGSLEEATKEIAKMVSAVKVEVRSHINITKSEEHHRLNQLETENAILKRDLQKSQEEVQRQAAIMQGLRDTLSRRMIRTHVENELIKTEVRQAIQNAKLDLDRMKQELHSSIETCVLKYQNHEYATSLKALQDLTDAQRQKVIAQSATLHSLIDSVGANDPMEGVKTMHSNLPPLYKKQLEQYNKEQLLNLIDIFSFEEGIVEIVGKSLYATDPFRTQQVVTTS